MSSQLSLQRNFSFLLKENVSILVTFNCITKWYIYSIEFISIWLYQFMIDKYSFEWNIFVQYSSTILYYYFWKGSKSIFQKNIVVFIDNKNIYYFVAFQNVKFIHTIFTIILYYYSLKNIMFFISYFWVELISSFAFLKKYNL